MGKLTGKVAIITGGAQGQGAAHARTFAREGAKVVITDLQENGKEIAEEIGETALFLKHDVSDEESWRVVVEAALRKFGKLNVLLNNAGYLRPRPLLEVTREDMDRHYSVNQLGVYLGMQAVARAIADAGGGTIINTSSGVALRGYATMFAYSATKWAIRGMTRCAAIEYAPLKIRVNTILPGLIDTPMFRNANSESQQDFFKSIIPSGHVGQPTDVAELAAFLASDAASYINGAEITVDGGVGA
jgi:3alpha(or 20beta)-hydroxysteroid dehydrogenase